jgi:heptosyltransferase II
VAKHAVSQGWQVLLFGSAADAPVTSQINQLTQNQCLDLGGKTSLSEVVDIMSLCSQIISNDSGLMHIAAALHVPLIAIFGSSNPQHTPPMLPSAVVAYLGLSCSPCFKRQCPLTGDAHLACLKKITPQTILAKL